MAFLALATSVRMRTQLSVDQKGSGPSRRLFGRPGRMEYLSTGMALPKESPMMRRVLMVSWTEHSFPHMVYFQNYRAHTGPSTGSLTG
jgi:hypothetical protein